MHVVVVDGEDYTPDTGVFTQQYASLPVVGMVRHFDQIHLLVHTCVQHVYMLHLCSNMGKCHIVSNVDI